mgnify:CR=1 FL=1
MDLPPAPPTEKTAAASGCPHAAQHGSAAPPTECPAHKAAAASGCPHAVQHGSAAPPAECPAHKATAASGCPHAAQHDSEASSSERAYETARAEAEASSSRGGCPHAQGAAPAKATCPFDVADKAPSGIVDVAAAPKPVGAYPHARKHGDFLFLSGIGSRTPTNEIPGGPIYDENRQPLEYDVTAQTHQVVANLKTILADCDASLEDIIDVQVFLVDMERDFAAFNKVYAEYFKDIRATRTTVSLRNLPTAIAVEFKVIACAKKAGTETETGAETASAEVSPSSGIVDVAAAPKPVGAYPHARRHGDFLFLSGIGSRTPGTNAIPGGPIYDENRQPLEYDAGAQTRQVIENIKTIMAGCGADLEDIVDVQVFLVDMERDYAAFETVYAEYFKDIRPALTTMSLRNLPTPIAVEFKVIAKAKKPAAETNATGDSVHVEFAPASAGPCPHARKHGNLFFLSGIDSRTPGTNEIPGGPIYDENRKPLEYDIVRQTHQAITNIKTVLYGGCDGAIEDVIDVQVFLVDMERDFAAFNKVYAQYFGESRPTRTTVSLCAHPHAVAVQFKVIASAMPIGGEGCPACKMQ